MFYKVQGFIIAKKSYKDTDKIFTVYTKQQGKIQFIAQGVKKISSKLSGNLEVLNSAYFVLAKGKFLDRVTAVDVKQSYEPIKNDFVKLVASMVAMELVEQLIKLSSPDLDIYNLIQDYLDINQKSPKTKLLLKLFILKLFILLGYKPNNSKYENFFESLENNSLEIFVNIKNDKAMDSLLKWLLVNQLDFPLKSQNYLTWLTGLKL